MTKSGSWQKYRVREPTADGGYWMKRTLSFACCLILSQPVFARDAVDVGRWTIDVASPNTCTATTFFQKTDDRFLVHVSIGYNARRKYASLSFTNAVATSLEEGSKVDLVMIFEKQNDEWDRGWGTTPFDVSVMENGVRFFSASKTFNIELLDDFAKSNAIGFLVKHEAVSAFPLAGSSAAIAELRKCAFEISGLNPEDPFLRSD